MPPSAMKHMLRTLGILKGIIKRGVDIEHEPMLMQMMGRSLGAHTTCAVLNSNLTHLLAGDTHC